MKVAVPTAGGSGVKQTIDKFNKRCSTKSFFDLRKPATAEDEADLGFPAVWQDENDL